MKELAKLFQRLGAEDALNLDGGGSSILVARQADGSLGVLNSPSDGHPRPVANGLEVTYDAAAAVTGQLTAEAGTSTSATVVIGAKHSSCGLGTLLRGDRPAPVAARSPSTSLGASQPIADDRAVEQHAVGDRRPCRPPPAPASPAPRSRTARELLHGRVVAERYGGRARPCRRPRSR